jgi:hypothetical protein
MICSKFDEIGLLVSLKFSKNFYSFVIISPWGMGLSNSESFLSKGDLCHLCSRTDDTKKKKKNDAWIDIYIF